MFIPLVYLKPHIFAPLDQVAEIRGDVVKAEWGQQICSYTLQPYKLVKDTRTGEETADVTGVLDGQGLDVFMTAYLRMRGKQQHGLTVTSLSFERECPLPRVGMYTPAPILFITPPSGRGILRTRPSV